MYVWQKSISRDFCVKCMAPITEMYQPFQWKSVFLALVIRGVFYLEDKL